MAKLIFTIHFKFRSLPWVCDEVILLAPLCNCFPDLQYNRNSDPGVELDFL